MVKNLRQKKLTKSRIILLTVLMVFVVVSCALFVNFKASAGDNPVYVKHIYFKVNTGESFTYNDEISGESGTSDFLDLGFTNQNVDFGYALDFGSNTFSLKGYDSSTTSIDPVEHNCHVKLTDSTHVILDYYESLEGQNATVTLYVQGPAVDVTFNGNGGNWQGQPTTTVSTYVGAGFIMPAKTPTYEGHEFLGYYTEQEGGKLITISSPTIDPVPEGGATLWAHWKDVSVATSVTVNSENGENFKYLIVSTPDEGQVTTESGETNNFSWDKATTIAADAILSYSALFTHNDEYLPAEVKSAPYTLALNTYDADLNVTYDLYFFTNGSAGSYITKASYMDSTLDETSKSIILKGANSFSVNVASKDDCDFVVSSTGNLLCNCEFTDYENNDTTTTKKTSKFDIELDKSTILYFTYNNSFMANEVSYDLPVSIFVLSMDNDNKYKLSSKYQIKGLVKNGVSNATTITVDGFQYGDEIVTTPSLKQILINPTDTTLTVLASGGSELVNSSFDANGGKFADSSEVLDLDQYTGSNLVLPEEQPSLDGMYFAGWYTAPEEGELVTTDMFPWDPDDENHPWDPEGTGLIDANTYYAHWAGSPGPEPEPEPVPGTETIAQTGDATMNLIAVLSVLLISAGCAFAISRRINKKH